MRANNASRCTTEIILISTKTRIRYTHINKYNLYLEIFSSKASDASAKMHIYVDVEIFNTQESK